MNEYEKYLFELLVHHKGNFVTAEVLADLYGADLQKDLQEIYGLYNVNIKRLATVICRGFQKCDAVQIKSLGYRF